MQTIKIEEGIFEIISSRVVDADRIHSDLSFMEQEGMLTFGDQTTRILSDEFHKEGYTVELTDLCYEDDLSIGLQMPDTWYLNRGLYGISISMYFNFLNYKEMAKDGELYTRNLAIAKNFGRIAAIEVYVEKDLRKHLNSRESRYFGTPRTLTECMRVLEGWDIKQIPRLKRYVTYADFIRLWCQVYFPGFKKEEWGLGKEASKAILQSSGTTSVREGIMFFWRNYLEKKIDKIAQEDIEVDILDVNFQCERSPRYVLLGEDIFSDESVDTGSEMLFRSFSESKIMRYPRNIQANEMQYKTAKLIQRRFPSTTIIMFKNPTTMPTFTMTKFDEVKEGISREVALVANGLRHVHSMLGGIDDK